MPVTRSASRLSRKGTIDLALSPAIKKPSSNPSKSKAKPKKTAASTSDTAAVTNFVIPERKIDPTLLPAVLTFSFEAAKNHLAGVDVRFNDVFNRLSCKPYEHLEPVDPFRSLVSSILGQQISWLAARSITHRFIRLYDPTLPETLPPPQDTAEKTITTSFPTAEQVAATDISVLRSAGLSGRKAEYVQDLASRFADGRLSTERLAKASDEELAEMLIEVRGIGMWTVHMFSIFTLRRPNILPVGDLGVQRGLVRWILSWHDSNFSSIRISPKKLPRPVDEVPLSPLATKSQSGPANGLSPLTEPADVDQDVSSIPPGTAPTTPTKGKPQTVDASFSLPTLPPPFTPSIKRTLDAGSMDGSNPPPPLPEGVTVSTLKSRLEGKKVKGAFLTPAEMEALTECWKPYRSLGVYYMWALAEDK